MKIHALHAAASLSCALLVWCFAGCSRTAPVVQWPELREMDEWAEKGEGWAEENKVTEMRNALPDLVKAGARLSASPIPPNAKDPAAVSLSMEDFRAVLKMLQKPAIPDGELKDAVASIHPLIEKLMSAAGLPHVHEHPGEKPQKK
jgi:hypothetical protein